MQDSRSFWCFFCVFLSLWRALFSNEIEPMQHRITHKGKDRVIAWAQLGDCQENSFENIDKSIGAFQPTLIILEGILLPFSLNSPVVFQKAKDLITSHMKEFARKEHAICFAHQHKIAFMGCEPSYQTILEECATLGYPPRDIIWLYVLKELSYWKKTNQLRGNFGALVAKYHQTSWKSVFTRPYLIIDFYLWYLNKMRKEFSLDTFTEEEIEPIETGQFLQRLAYKIDEIRKSSLDQAIYRGIKRYDRILYFSDRISLETFEEILKERFVNIDI